MSESKVRTGYVRPLDIKHGQVDMAHGSGGRAMAQLIEELFAKYLGNEYLAQGDDGALLPAPGAGKLVMATDCHVVSPLFFPGGDIGCLSVISPSMKTRRSGLWCSRLATTAVRQA